MRTERRKRFASSRSGKTGATPGNREAQACDVYAHIRCAFTVCGATLDDVVEETIHTTHLEAFGRVKFVRTEFFARISSPASGTWHEVARLAHPDFLVEVKALALAPALY